MFTGRIPPRPDLKDLARMLTAQVQAAHRQITNALIPPGEPGQRDWQVARPYRRRHLAAHAAASGYLDDLASDPGFLLSVDRGAVLAQRANLHTPGGRRALAAFDLGLHDWEAATFAARLDRLTANAAAYRHTRSVRHAGTQGASGRFTGQRGQARNTDGWPVMTAL